MEYEYKDYLFCFSCLRRGHFQEERVRLGEAKALVCINDSLENPYPRGREVPLLFTGTGDMYGIFSSTAEAIITNSRLMLVKELTIKEARLCGYYFLEHLVKDLYEKFKRINPKNSRDKILKKKVYFVKFNLKE